MLTRSKVNDAHQFKPLLTEIEEEPVSPLGRTTFWLVVAIIIFFIAWSILGEVDIVVSANGKVIPDGHVKILQPLDTGIVRKILVKEGDYVKRGQVVMEIDPSTIDPEMESTGRNLRYAKLEMSRIDAALTGRSFTPGKNTDPDAVAAQLNLYAAATANLDKQLAAKRSELDKLDEEQKSAQIDQDENQELLEVSLDKERRLNAVVDIIARDEYEKVTSDILLYRNKVQQAKLKIAEVSHRRNQVLHEMEQIRQNFRKSNLEELTQNHKTANELSAKLKQTTFKSAKQQIISPVDGYVDALFIHTIGGVVTPAEKLISIVPSDIPMIVKADVLNRDIGFVDKDMPVNIKVDTFDFQKYGMFEGKVKLVSRDSHQDEADRQGLQGLHGLIYDVYITPTKNTLLVDGLPKSLAPGMSLTAEIKVGKRRIIEFFIYPLIKYLHEGMSVR